MNKILFTATLMASAATAANAQFVVTTNSGETTEINSNVTFSQNAAGNAWSVGDTYNSALDLSQISSITLAQQQSVAVGDFLFSDGTWSSTLEAGKTPVAVVFWTGNPTTDDAALAEDHPGCVHGLAVGLKQGQNEWQDDYSGFDDEVGMTVGEWIEENTTYPTIESGTALDDPINKIMGYSNTCALNEFNDSDYGWDYEVLVAGRIDFIMDNNAAPASTSGWYMPSAKEMSLLISGPYDGNIDDIGYLDEPLVSNLALVNGKLAQISGAAAIDGVYWTSNEASAVQVFTIKTGNALLMETSKGGSNKMRPILAF